MNAWAWALIDAFAEAGVTDVVASPGSRSTPFLLAAAARLRVHDVLDERAAAFLALGMARATGRPPLGLCTSGSAGAHWFPALVEADAASIPMLLLTADRPPELQGCGASQTIDQTKLFGDHVRRFLAVPEEPLAARRVAAQAVHHALHPIPGPVHLNAHARKPLETTPAERAFPTLPRVFAPRAAPDPAAIDELARACNAARRGLIVCGPGPVQQAASRPSLAALAAVTGFPVVAEAASQLRQPGVLDAFDWIPLPEPPDLILQLGAAPTSTRLESLPVPRAIIAPRGWPDPGGHATVLVQADLAATLAELATRLRPREPTAFAARLAAASVAARRAIDADPTWGEGLATRLVAGALDADTLFMVGNSLPIRLVDRYAAPFDAPVLSQRGAAGIDGLVAGATGAALATGRPVTLLLGDVSFLHDLDGLLAARLAPPTIVVLHNDGGRIFEQLPIGASAQIAHFTTPHGLDLRPAAELAGLPYVEVGDAAALSRALTARTPGVICVRVPPSGAAAQQRRLEEQLR